MHVERMPQHELDLFLLAKVGQPVPGKHRAPTEGWSRRRRPDRCGTVNQIQKVIGARLQIAMHENLARLIDDAAVHFSGMQVDSAVEWVLLIVESHHRSSDWGECMSLLHIGGSDPVS